MLRKLVLCFFAISALILARDPDPPEKFGYLIIHTDSVSVPVYLDGIYLQQAPMDKVVPVSTGKHSVSYLPPELERKMHRRGFDDAIQTVFVTEDDTVDVILYMESRYRDRIQKVKLIQWITLGFGSSMLLALGFILWSIA